MKYSFSGRVRYSETDSTGKLYFPALMDYFQDTSTFHGEDNNISIKYLYNLKLTWVLGGWQVRLYKPVYLGDVITASTWAYKFSHCLGFRNYSLEDKDGVLCAAADTQYVLIDTEKQKPAEIPGYFAELYTMEEQAHIDLKLPRKIIPEKTGRELEPIPVFRYMLDTNNHVNNSQYIKTAMSLLPDDFIFNCFRAEYKKQAHLEDIFYPLITEKDNCIQIRLADKDGGLFFIGEWSLDKEESGEKYASNR